MKSRILFLLFVIPMILTGCGGGDDPVTPDPVVPPLVEGTIGSEGDELVADDIVVSVPADALPGDTELKIYPDEAESPYGGGAPVYRLEGLPEVLAEPVTVRLRTGGGKASGATLFRGEERDSYEGGRALTWSHVASRDSAGWVIAELDRGAYELDGEKAAMDVKLAAELGLERTPTSAGHYEIFYHPDRTTNGQAALIAAHFEQAWTRVTELGFQFGGQDIWPRPVYLGDVPVNGMNAMYVVAPYGKGHFVIQPELLSNSLAMGIVIGHEVFHSAQDHFDTRPPATWKTLNQDRLWLDEACSSWFEQKFYPEDDFYPLSMGDHAYLAPMTMFAGQKSTSWATSGYGLSQLIKYVVDRQGEGRILQFYQKFVDVGDATPAFLEVVDPAMETWVVDFFHEYLTTGIYPYLDDPSELPNWGHTLSLVAGEDDSGRGVWPVWNLGASMTHVDVTDDRDEPYPMLEIVPKEGGPIQVSFYGRNPGEVPVLIATDEDSLVVDDLPDLCRDYEDFMVVGVSTAPWTAEYDNKEWRDPRIAFKDDELARFETAEIWFKHIGHMVDGAVHNLAFLEIEVDVGSVRNHVYHAEWDTLHVGRNCQSTGYVTIEFDPATMNIRSFSGATTDHWIDNSSLYTSEISGLAVPIVTNKPDEMSWEIRSFDACGVVTAMDYQSYFDDEWLSGLDFFECVESSYLVVNLKDEN